MGAMQNKEIKSNLYIFPRIIISAMRGSGAKTILSLGITIALKRRGKRVIPFKKGPDYIDAAWLARAAGERCRHLDLYLMGDKGVKEVFFDSVFPEAIAIIEGNRGLYDGVDIYGTYSTARIASLLEIPVILIADCTKATNTISALVMGCQTFDPNVSIKGVVLNQISGKRHGELIRKSIQYHTGLPVLGMLPHLNIQLPERHLGLTTVEETGDFVSKLELLGDTAEKYLDMDQILQLAQDASPLVLEDIKKNKAKSKEKKSDIKVGIIKDPAFQFYYQENLEALESEGANIIEFNSMQDKELKPIDMLYIAGGFPEVHAELLSKNKSFRDSIKRFAEKGLPVYGECGAVMYLGRSVVYKGNSYEMCGVIPLDFELKKKPVGHGYSEIVVDRNNPFFPKGMSFKGHEFHYSYPVNWNGESNQSAFSVKKGFGFEGNRDGIFINNVFATYTHLHATGAKEWAKYLIELAERRKFSKEI